MLPGNFTRGAKKLSRGGGRDTDAGGTERDNDAEVTYFSPLAKDAYDEDDVIKVAAQVRSVRWAQIQGPEMSQKKGTCINYDRLCEIY